MLVRRRVAKLRSSLAICEIFDFFLIYLGYTMFKGMTTRPIYDITTDLLVFCKFLDDNDIWIKLLWTMNQHANSLLRLANMRRGAQTIGNTRISLQGHCLRQTKGSGVNQARGGSY